MTLSIEHVILGFLSEIPLSGYDLKKKFASSEIFHWSGNSNQIYRSLVKLHEKQLVTVEVQYQDGKPPKKLYTITETGLAELRRWAQSVPDLPQFQNPLLMQLRWADQLERNELGSMLLKYKEEMSVRVAMLREQMYRVFTARPKTDPQSVSYAQRANQHLISLFEFELEWVQMLLNDLNDS